MFNLCQTGRRSICVIADVSKENEVKDMVELTVKELGELNVGSFSPCFVL